MGLPTHLREVFYEDTHYPLQDVADARQPLHACVRQDGFLLIGSRGCRNRRDVLLGDAVVHQYPAQRLGETPGVVAIRRVHVLAQ